MIFMLISWYTLSLISLFIISALTTHIINKIYLFCSLFFVSYSIFSIITSECMFLLILMSVLISFFFMFLNISSILISCITTSKLILHKHAFNNISLIIIIINSYTFMTSIKSTHEKLYAICIEWTKLSEVENHLQSTWLLHAVETVSFETMYQICSRWLHVKEWMF